DVPSTGLHAQECDEYREPDDIWGRVLLVGQVGHALPGLRADAREKVALGCRDAGGGFWPSRRPIERLRRSVESILPPGDHILARGRFCAKEFPLPAGIVGVLQRFTFRQLAISADCRLIQLCELIQKQFPGESIK